MLKLLVVAVVMFLIGAYWLKNKLVQKDPNTQIKVDELLKEDAKAAADYAKMTAATLKTKVDETINQR